MIDLKIHEARCCLLLVDRGGGGARVPDMSDRNRRCHYWSDWSSCRLSRNRNVAVAAVVEDVVVAVADTVGT